MSTKGVFDSAGRIRQSCEGASRRPQRPAGPRASASTATAPPADRLSDERGEDTGQVRLLSAIGRELQRRAPQCRSESALAFTVTERWVSADDLQRIRNLDNGLGVALHDAARPHKDDDVVPIAATIVLFELAGKSQL